MLTDFLMNCWQKVAFVFVQVEIQVIFLCHYLKYIICHTAKRCT